MPRVTVACLSLALVSLACATRAPRMAASPRPDAGTPTEQLQRDLTALFTSTSIDHAHWAVHVQSLARGDTLYASNALRLMVPASVQKLLTTSVAAERLGWDYRFTT